MKLIIKKCHECGVLGVGPRAVKLYPMNGRLLCKQHWQDALQWEDQREYVTRAIDTTKEFTDAVLRVQRYGRRTKGLPAKDWRGYIEECAGLAGWALLVGDRRTFVYYFARAVWAWALKEET